jgi:hypothetical protein
VTHIVVRGHICSNMRTHMERGTSILKSMRLPSADDIADSIVGEKKSRSITIEALLILY